MWEERAKTFGREPPIRSNVICKEPLRATRFRSIAWGCGTAQGRAWQRTNSSRASGWEKPRCKGRRMRRRRCGSWLPMPHIKPVNSGCSERRETDQPRKGAKVAKNESGGGGRFEGFWVAGAQDLPYRQGNVRSLALMHEPTGGNYGRQEERTYRGAGADAD